MTILHVKNYFKLPSCFLCLFLFGQVGFADTAQMDVTLQRINTILSQIYPLINRAQTEQNQNAQIQFQFQPLRADISKIQAGINQAVHGVSVQPRQVAPLQGDYLPSTKNTLERP